jgi:hypothetical protein
MKVNRPLGILYRFYLHLKDKFDPRPPVSEEEIQSYEIVKKLISLPESELFFGPVSEKRIIRNKEKQISILIDTRNISITNHVYNYSIYLENEQLYKNIITEFDSKLEEREQASENEIRKNIQHSLKSIFKNLS